MPVNVHARRGSERGSGLVEFCLLLTPLLLLLFGVVEGSRLLFTYGEISDAARQGARYAIVAFTSATDASVTAAAKQALDSALANDMTCTVSTNTDARYAQVACSYNFRTVAPRLLPFFNLTVTGTSRMYVP